MIVWFAFLCVVVGITLLVTSFFTGAHAVGLVLVVIGLTSLVLIALFLGGVTALGIWVRKKVLTYGD